MVRYPPGWVQPAPGYLRADEEFFILEGSLEINGQSYGEYSYAHLPAGYARQSFASRTGAVAVTFFSGEPDWSAGEAAPGMYDPKRLVEYINGLNQPYDNDFSRMGSDDVNQNGIALKLLREDPYDREQTWLLGAIAFWPGGAVEIHPVVEEMFLVSGEIVGNWQHENGRLLLAPAWRASRAVRDRRAHLAFVSRQRRPAQHGVRGAEETV